MGFFGGGGSPYYISGVGAPGSLNKPQGTIYTRTDAQGLYISAPTFSTPSIVQSAHGAAHSTNGGPVFGSPVTAGNLLLAAVGWNGDLTSEVQSGWSILQSSNGGGGGGSPTQAILYRYAQGGDGTTPPDFFNGAAVPFWGYDAIEFHGVQGNILADIVSKNIAFGQSPFDGSFTMPSQVTTRAGQLAVTYLTGYNGTANFAGPAGYTVQDDWIDGNFGTMWSGVQAPASGTQVGGFTEAKPTGVNSMFYGSVIILQSAPTPGWTQITIP